MEPDVVIRARGYNGEITFDGRTLEINREGFRGSRRTAGRGTKRIPISSVTAVQLKKPLGGWTANRFGFIEFSFMGGQEAKGFSLWGAGTGIGQVQRHFNDENTVLFKAEHLSEFETLQRVVEEVVFSRSSAPEKATGSTRDKYDQLNKLKGLLDAGVLTQEEFELEKQKILDGQ